MCFSKKKSGAVICPAQAKIIELYNKDQNTSDLVSVIKFYFNS